MLNGLLTAAVSVALLLMLMGRSDLVKRLSTIAVAIALVLLLFIVLKSSTRDHSFTVRQTESSKTVGTGGAVILPSGRLHIVNPPREQGSNF